MPAIYLVVLTATIVPAPMDRLRRADPRVRLEDYKNGLRFWLRHSHPSLTKILFIENSGADLSELQAIYQHENPLNKDVEFISMNANVIPKGFHYGYGELQMLDLGLQQSRLVRETTHMIKATGRLTFPAIGKLLDRLGNGTLDVCVECRVPVSCIRQSRNPYRVLVNRTEAYASTQLMIFSHRFYREELQKLYSVWTGSARHMETLLYPVILRHEGEPGVFLRYPINVEPHGVAGHSGVPYSGLRHRVVSSIRAVVRAVAPSYWV